MVRTLRARLILTYGGLTLLTVASLALYTLGVLEDLLKERLRQDLTEQARLVAGHVAPLLASRQSDGVRLYLEQVDHETRARTVAVDADRQIVGTTEVEERHMFGRRSQETGLAEAVQGRETGGLLPGRTPGSEVLYAAVPIVSDGRPIGAVRVAYRVEDISETLRSINLNVGLASLAAALLAAAVGAAVARAIANPIRQLARGAHALAAGDLEQHLEARSSDEVGELVDSFNSLAYQLRTLEESRREFAADVSHELHSLAAAMQTAAEALSRGAGDVPEVRQRLVEGLVGHTHRLSRLAEDLLQLARIQVGRLTLEREACSLTDVVEQTVAEFGAEAAAHGVTLNVEADEQMPFDGDQARLVQTLGNLVENALKYTPSGGSVWVTAHRQDGVYELRVADTGPGIPPEELPRIWDRYHRVEGRASDGPSGTGLGLAIAAGIVKSHGGTIGAVSAVGQGTTFTIRLPVGGAFS
ncbi:MAG: HAMP domain-containing protein [Chloroflexi bacterium]|nr:HAMP domain-containing protein [Chloroflexota bacterium]